MHFQIYRTKFRREWRWRLRAANNRIIASGEGYRNRQDCVDAVALVQSSASAQIKD